MKIRIQILLLSNLIGLNSCANKTHKNGLHSDVNSVSMDEMLSEADFITMHIPFTGAAVLGSAEFAKMKKGVFVVDAARGGTIDEDALLASLENGTVAAAGLDVFINEPSPRQDILSHPRISLTPVLLKFNPYCLTSKAQLILISICNT